MPTMATFFSNFGFNFQRHSLLTTVLFTLFCSFIFSNNLVAGLPASQAVNDTASGEPTCRNEAYE